MIQRNFPDTKDEACGIWLEDTTAIMFENFADNPKETFTFSPEIWEWIRTYNDMVRGIFHSHPSEAQPAKLSLEDILLAKRLELDIAVYHPEFYQWDYYSPHIPHPYPLRLHGRMSPKSADWWIGHEYQPARSDCYSLVCDWYAAKGLQLNFPKRSYSDYGEERPKAWNRFYQECKQEGWELVTNPQHGNVALLRIDSDYPNHIGVLLWNDDRADFNFLHQMGGKRKSEIIQFKEVAKLNCGIFTQTGF